MTPKTTKSHPPLFSLNHPASQRPHRHTAPACKPQGTAPLTLFFFFCGHPCRSQTRGPGVTKRHFCPFQQDETLPGSDPHRKRTGHEGPTSHLHFYTWRNLHAGGCEGERISGSNGVRFIGCRQSLLGAGDPGVGCHGWMERDMRWDFFLCVGE